MLICCGTGKVLIAIPYISFAILNNIRLVQPVYNLCVLEVVPITFHYVLIDIVKRIFDVYLIIVYRKWVMITTNLNLFEFIFLQFWKLLFELLQ